MECLLGMKLSVGCFNSTHPCWLVWELHFVRNGIFNLQLKNLPTFCKFDYMPTPLFLHSEEPVILLWGISYKLKKGELACRNSTVNTGKEIIL